MRIDSLMVARMSGSVPAAAGLVRLVRRRGGVSRILVMILRSAASSPGVQAVKDRCLSAFTPDAIQPRSGCSWSSSGPGSVPGITSSASASATDCARSTSRVFAGASAPRK
jgi:hypothetical protein